MSNNEKEIKTPDNQEKVMTRYDLKQQKRKEQEAKEKKEQRISLIIGVVIVAAIVCLIASFPIRTYLAVNKTFVEIGGDKITQVEFDYNYNAARNNYSNQYGMYMSYMGVDLTGDLSRQMYSETMTWQDFFEEQAVENIRKNKAILAEAAAAGFTYDAEEDFAQMENTLKEQAAAAGVGFNDFLKANFGKYATMGRLESFIKEEFTASAYYNEVAEQKAPAEEEITAYYEENKNTYDSVDYRVTTIDAVLPTEPTELADPVEEETPAETEDSAAEAEDSTSEASDGEEAEEEAYEPSAAEVTFAMTEALEKALKAQESVASDGELTEGALYATTNSNYRDWLFEEGRKAGETYVAEDNYNNRYYVVAFEKRYRDETPTVNARVITTQETDAQTILDEWTAGEATEESFIALAEKYSEDTYADGGLYEGIVDSGLDEAVSAWLFAGERAVGDTTAITLEDGTNYVMYFAGQGDPEWKLSIRNNLLGVSMAEYLTEISENIEVVDAKGNLNYLKVQEAEETAATEEADSTEAGTEEAAESTEAGTEEPTDPTESAAEETAESTEAASEAEASEETMAE